MGTRLTIRSLPVLLLLGSTLSSGPAYAQKTITGKTWTRWDEGRKIAYLTGFYAGFTADGDLFRQAERDHPLRKPAERNPASVDRYKAERREYFSRELKYDFKLIMATLDAFYTDPDNMPIPVNEAIRIVALRADGNHERSDYLLQRERRKALKGQ